MILLGTSIPHEVRYTPLSRAIATNTRFGYLPPTDEEHSLREPVKKAFSGSLSNLPPLRRLEMLRRNADAVLGRTWRGKDDSSLIWRDRSVPEIVSQYPRKNKLATAFPLGKRVATVENGVMPSPRRFRRLLATCLRLALAAALVAGFVIGGLWLYLHPPTEVESGGVCARRQGQDLTDTLVPLAI